MKLLRIIISFLSFDLPVFDAAGLGGEVDANADYLPAIHPEFAVVFLLFNLPQSLLRAAVIFQLYEVDVVVSLDVYVYTSVGGCGLCLGFQPHKIHEKVESVVEVVLVVHLHLEINTGEIRLHALHRLVRLA